MTEKMMAMHALGADYRQAPSYPLRVQTLVVFPRDGGLCDGRPPVGASHE